jgi:hypothetical protein
MKILKVLAVDSSYVSNFFKNENLKAGLASIQKVVSV